MPNNVLIFSDPHIHTHKKSSNRLQDCIEVLEWVFDTAIEREVKTVIGLGDLFHDRTKIEVLTLFRVFEVFDKYFSKKSPFELYLLLGNHDMWHRDRWDVHSPAFLRAFDAVNVIDHPCSLDIQGELIDFLPFTEDPLDDLARLRTMNPRTNRGLLCSHLAVDGAKLNAFTEADVVVEHDGEMVKVDHHALSGWRHVLLGHYHGEQVLGDNGEVEYVGSPQELTRSEAFQQKHIILHDLDTFQREYIVNDFSPKHLILKPDQLKSQDLTQHFVTVMVPETISQSEIADMRHDILRNHDVGSLEIKTVRKKNRDEDAKTIQDARAILETQDEMVTRWVAECDPKDKAGLLESVLLKAGLRLIQTNPGDENSLEETKAALRPLNLFGDNN